MNLSDLNIDEVMLKRNPELAAMVKCQLPASKYHNAKSEAAGMTFHSGREAVRIGELILLEERHEIFGLRLQVRFPVASKITYIADAVYLDEKLQVHVEDAKGILTKEYRIKKKLFEERYKVKIMEV